MPLNLTQSDTTKNVAVGGLGGAGGFAGLLAFIRANWPDLLPWPVEYDVGCVALAATILAPLLSRAVAFWRHPDKKTRHYLPLLLCLAAMSGCATTLPAVGGKTHYNVEFSDVTEAQATHYSMAVKAPAGVDLATVTGMSYDWLPDGSGSINVSQQGGVDTQGQAALINEVSRQQIEAFHEAFQVGVTSALNALAPFIGQYLDARVREGEIKADVANTALERLNPPYKEGAPP